jgi:hypothetical protein
MQVLRASSAHSDHVCLKRPATRRDATGRRSTALLSPPERSRPRSSPLASSARPAGTLAVGDSALHRNESGLRAWGGRVPFARRSGALAFVSRSRLARRRPGFRFATIPSVSRIRVLQLAVARMAPAQSVANRDRPLLARRCLLPSGKEPWR